MTASRFIATPATALGARRSMYLRRWLRALALVGCGAVSQAAFSADGVVALPAPDAACPPPAPAFDFSPAATKRAAARATDRGLLWRIEKDGRTSWLYGTLHVGTADTLMPGPRLLAALVQSDTIALELDVLDPATQAVFAAPADAGLLARVLTPERRARLERQAERACLPAEVRARLLAMRPILQVATLTLLAASSEGLHADFGVDAFLAGLGRGRRIPVVALESAEGQLAALTGNSEQEEASQVDSMLDALESGHVGPQLAELAAVWRRSDLARLQDYPQWCDCARTPEERRTLARLLDDRNPGLADGIARLHAQGRRVFGAVGALHMVGPRGLPALLEAQGFHVTAAVPATPPRPGALE